MEKDTTIIITTFRNLSSKIYDLIFNDFRQSIKSLDRQRDENVFQQLQARYTDKLKNHLEQEAEKILEEHRGYNAPRSLQRELTGHISYLLSEFQVRAKSM